MNRHSILLWHSFVPFSKDENIPKRRAFQFIQASKLRAIVSCNNFEKAAQTIFIRLKCDIHCVHQCICQMVFSTKPTVLTRLQFTIVMTTDSSRPFCQRMKSDSQCPNSSRVLMFSGYSSMLSRAILFLIAL